MKAGSTAGSPPDSVLRRLAVTPRLLVCCDFDGTLSNLVDDPGAARPVPGAVGALDSLGALPDTWAAVVSGRSLADLVQLAELPSHVKLVGSHGAEFESGVIDALGDDESARLDALVEECRSLAATAPGALIEPKPASVAVHVRRSSRDDARRLLDAVRSGPGTAVGVHVTEGKEVVELSVVLVGKGSALDSLRHRAEATAVLFAGDDVTDETAFAVLGDADVGVKVGVGSTAAGWRVEDPEALVALLERLLTLRQA